MAPAPIPQIYTVRYAILPGDYNDDGVVDAGDYSVWRDAMGSYAVLPNDTTPSSVSQADYDLWVANFGAIAPAAGQAAIAWLDESQVNEPLSVAASGSTTISAQLPERVATFPGMAETSSPRRFATNADRARHASATNSDQLLLLLAEQRARRQIDVPTSLASNDEATSVDEAEEPAGARHEAFRQFGEMPAVSL